MYENEVKDQFSLRSSTFEESANWITDRDLIGAHVRLAGPAHGSGLELCCGTGIISRALIRHGWQMTGIDLTQEMVERARQHFPVMLGNAEGLPFEDDSFDLVVMRQALHFLDAEKVFGEVSRVLKTNGIFVVSQTVPFSKIDAGWLKRVHFAKQAQMKAFHTHESIKEELVARGFAITGTESLTIGESIMRWMDCAPELSPEAREEVIRLIRDGPEDYRDVRNVRVVGKELWEDWNWVVFAAAPVLE